MLVAVATASLRTISVAPARKANVPVAMTINHKPPAILALKRGDACAIRSIIHNLPAAPPHERGKVEFSSFVRLQAAIYPGIRALNICMERLTRTVMREFQNPAQIEGLSSEIGMRRTTADRAWAAASESTSVSRPRNHAQDGRATSN